MSTHYFTEKSITDGQIGMQRMPDPGLVAERGHTKKADSNNRKCCEAEGAETARIIPMR